jgi:hypothetical protein
MAYPTYPIDLPCPVTAPLTPDERRDLTALAGPRASSTYQFAEQHTQRLVFRLTFAKAEPWEAWWRQQLIQGGSWFMSEWPHPTGEAVPRRFITAPEWSAIKGVGWDVSIVAEVQSTDQLPTATEAPLWLDNFSGPAGSLGEGDGHAQDIPLNESHWDENEGLVFSLDGLGNAVDGVTGNYGYTVFDQFGGIDPPQLAPGWRFEMELTPVPSGAQATGISFVSENGNNLDVLVEPLVDNVTVRVSIAFGLGGYVEYDLPYGSKRITLRTVGDTSFRATINGDVFDSVDADVQFVPVDATLYLPSVPSGTTAGNLLGKISRVALFGTALPPEPLVPGAPLVEFDALDVDSADPDVHEGFRVTPTDEYAGGPAGGFNVTFNVDDEIIASTPGVGGRIGPDLDNSRVAMTLDASITARHDGGGNFYGGIGFSGSGGESAQMLIDHNGTDYTVSLVTINGTEVTIDLPPEVDFAANTEVRMTFNGAEVVVYVDDVLVDSAACSFLLDFDATQCLIEVGGHAIVNKSSITYLTA